MISDLVIIKGGKEGLRLQLDEAAEWSAVIVALRTQFDQSGSFFAGARLLVDVGSRLLNEQQLREMLTLMQQYALQPVSLTASARESRNAARSVGLPARPAPARALAASPTLDDEAAILVTRTVRSGQVVRHHGHITLVGDVNPGSEVIAGGSVVVWGRLRGLVHAGALGNRTMFICALELQPTQLRIADFIARTPEGTAGHTPEVARVERDQIIVEAWEVFRK